MFVFPRSVTVLQTAIADEVAFKYHGYVLQMWANGGYDDTPSTAAAGPTAPADANSTWVSFGMFNIRILM